MLNQLLVAFHSILELPHRQRFVFRVGIEDIPRAVEISRVVALEERYIGAIVDGYRVKTCIEVSDA